MKVPSSRHSASHSEYWLGLLSKDLGRPSLLLDYKRPASFAARTESVTIEVGGKIFRDLRKLVGGDSPLVLLAALIAALFASLRRYSTARRALVGTPALAEHPEANAVVLAVEIDDEATTFRDLLIAVRDSLTAAYRHQDYPIDTLAEDLGLEAPAGRCPFFDILVRAAGLHGTPPTLEHDLDLAVTESQDHIRICFSFSPALFQRATIERFGQQLMRTLGQGLSQLSTALTDLTGVDEAETARLVALGRGRHVERPACAGVHELFEHQTRRCPDGVALRSNQTVLTYAELDRRANRIAHHLIRREVGPGVLVGLCMERSWELVAAMLEHVRQKRGGYRVRAEDNPKKTPLTTVQLLARARRAGTHIGTLCDAIHRRQGEAAVRRILGVLSLAKKYGVSAVEDASAAALELHVYEYRFVRRYLERRPPLALRQVDPLIRELTQYRDLINLKIQEQEQS